MRHIKQVNRIFICGDHLKNTQSLNRQMTVLRAVYYIDNNHLYFGYNENPVAIRLRRVYVTICHVDSLTPRAFDAFVAADVLLRPGNYIRRLDLVIKSAS